MGLVDSQRNRRGSWEVLRDEYSPALIDSLRLSAAANGQRTATITLHTRGPVDVDMPAYTLRGYTLRWTVTSPDGSSQFSEGNISMPTMAPGTYWSGDGTVAVPGGNYIITISIIRPTGFSVTDHSYDSKGNLLP